MKGAGSRAADLVRLVHDSPGVTRAEAARRLGVGTGSANDLVARLAAAGLVAETRVAPSGRGRPTTALGPHPRGPVVLAVSVTYDEWRVRAAQVGGGWVASAEGTHHARPADDVLAEVRAAVRRLRRRLGGRVRGVGVSMPGIVRGRQLVESGHLGWAAVDLSVVATRGDAFVAGNDATFATSAEARRGAASGAAVSVHVRVDAGVGGGVVDAGRTSTGATGAAGEFGHLPFGDPALRCPCGAHGCWGDTVDGGALARLLGAAPSDPVAFFRSVVARAASGAPAETAALTTVATRFGRGVAGLVNALDPGVVTLGGLALPMVELARPAFDEAYSDGLMAFRRPAPPPVLTTTLGEDGPLVGAAEETWLRLWDDLVSS